jgi:hypothetical protein
MSGPCAVSIRSSTRSATSSLRPDAPAKPKAMIVASLLHRAELPRFGRNLCMPPSRHPSERPNHETIDDSFSDRYSRIECSRT